MSKELTTPIKIDIPGVGTIESADLYLASEVNAILADKDKEIESLKASHYAEMVDAGMRERKLKRALYKACANWCINKSSVLDYQASNFERFLPTKGLRIRRTSSRWMEAFKKCRAKEERYGEGK